VSCGTWCVKLLVCSPAHRALIVQATLVDWYVHSIIVWCGSRQVLQSILTFRSLNALTLMCYIIFLLHYPCFDSDPISDLTALPPAPQCVCSVSNAWLEPYISTAGKHQIYGHVRCIYTVLVNPTNAPSLLIYQCPGFLSIFLTGSTSLQPHPPSPLASTPLVGSSGSPTKLSAAATTAADAGVWHCLIVIRIFSLEHVYRVAISSCFTIVSSATTAADAGVWHCLIVIRIFSLEHMYRVAISSCFTKVSSATTAADAGVWHCLIVIRIFSLGHVYRVAISSCFTKVSSATTAADAGV